MFIASPPLFKRGQALSEWERLTAYRYGSAQKYVNITFRILQEKSTEDKSFFRTNQEIPCCKMRTCDIYLCEKF